MFEFEDIYILLLSREICRCISELNWRQWSKIHFEIIKKLKLAMFCFSSIDFFIPIVYILDKYLLLTTFFLFLHLIHTYAAAVRLNDDVMIRTSDSNGHHQIFICHILCDFIIIFTQFVFLDELYSILYCPLILIFNVLIKPK